MTEYTSLSSEELITLYHKINAELTQRFRERAIWNEQQERINNLGEISKELIRRKVEINEHPGMREGDRLAS